MLGHQAASNAPLTSRLTITVHCFNLKLSSIHFLTSIAASTVPLWGVNPYWLALNRSLEYIWNSILSIISFSNNLPPILIRLARTGSVCLNGKRWPAVVNVAMNLKVHHNVEISLSSWGLVSFARTTLLCDISCWNTIWYMYVKKNSFLTVVSLCDLTDDTAAAGYLHQASSYILNWKQQKWGWEGLLVTK